MIALGAACYGGNHNCSTSGCTCPCHSDLYVSALERRLAEQETELIEAAHRVHDPLWILDQVYTLFLKEGDLVDDMIDRIFPHADPSYRDEWRRTFHRGFNAVWARLDNDNKARFVARIIAGYRDRVGINGRVLLERWAEQSEQLDALKWQMEELVAEAWEHVRGTSRFSLIEGRMVADDEGPYTLVPEDLERTLTSLPLNLSKFLTERDWATGICSAHQRPDPLCDICNPKLADLKRDLEALKQVVEAARFSDQQSRGDIEARERLALALTALDQARGTGKEYR